MLRIGLAGRYLCSKMEASRGRSLSNAILALGGNVGNVAGNFERGLQSLEEQGIKVLRTSHLYRSPAMHILDQPDFVNAAACVQTNLTATDLLSVLKRVEVSAGRQLDGHRWGPRPLDIDIVFFNNDNIESDVLTVPHLRWRDRPFVCRPILDLQDPQDVPKLDIWHKVQAAMAELPESDVKQLQQLWPMKPGLLHSVRSSTLVMGILNVTPDSFSDGGLHDTLESAVVCGLELVRQGADIIDIGGQSTRPGSIVLGPAEELQRILPVIRRLAGVPGITISVDTFYAEVAEAAVAAGAHIVNDVSGGRGDSSMLPTVARLGVPYIMMHSRGSPGGMHSRDHKVYSDVDVEVASELQQAVDAATAAGVRAWNIMLDPGIGFAKGAAENFHMLTAISRIRKHLKGPMKTAPMLVGPSRKGFLGQATGRAAADRDIATAAACSISIVDGANAIRVHNVSAGVDVARVCDASMQS